MNLFQQGAAWLGDQLKTSAGVAVTYTPVAGDELEIIGTPALHQYEIVDEQAGLLTQIVMYEWLFTAVDLSLTPQAGDLITADFGIYEVQPKHNDPCFEFLDTSGLLLRVYTKRIS